MKDKYIIIGIIILASLMFSVYVFISNKSFPVVDVKSFNTIAIDYNRNGIPDDNEYLKFLSDYQDVNSVSDPDNLGLNDDYIKLFDFLTLKFVKDNLLDKSIVIKYKDKKPLIFVENINFNEHFISSGYLFKNGKPISETSYLKLLENIKKADYKIYNIKSKKYHELSCKFGKLAHDFIYLPKNQIPAGSVHCKVCSDTEHVKLHKKQRSNLQLVCDDFGIKILVTDFTTKLLPDKSCKTDISSELIKHINNSKKSIDIAIFGYDKVPVIEKSIKQAIARGVVVRLVRDVDSKNSNIYSDTDYLSNIIKNFNADYPIKSIKNPSAYSNYLMHNKFFIFDDSIVITGSANLSATDMSGFNSNSVIVIPSDKVAKVYKQEFEQMYSGKFHYLKKEVNNKTNILFKNSVISVYFSPVDLPIDNALVHLINKAKSYVYLPTFLITDSNIALSLINAKKRGVDVKVIIDATNAKNTYSKHKLLRANGIKVKVENYAGKLHSKSIIIDDTYTVIGSMNFSKNGNMRNDENIVIIKNSKITKFYKAFFLYLWSKISDFWLTHEPSAESIYSIGSCSDGIDNDYDGLIDSADEGCRIKNH